MHKKFAFVCCLVITALVCRGADAATERATIAIYGATPSGISAAVAAAREGSDVLLIERTTHIGGLMANGLGATDIKNRGAVGGLFLEFVKSVKQHYVDTYGAGSPQDVACNDGYYFEPHVAEKILNAMIAAQPKIRVLTNTQLEQVRTRDGSIRMCRFVDRAGGQKLEVEAKVFVDATYEGDLGAMAGAPYRVGREPRALHGEPYGGVVYWDYRTKQYYPELSTGEGDDRIQAYNYRLCLTSDPSNLTPVTRPENYDRFEYMIVARQFRLGKLKSFKDVVHIVPMPNGKSDTNNHTIPLLSTDLPEENYPYPEASWEWRDAFAKRLREYTLGLLYYCQNDHSVPEQFRLEARRWGLAADEYEDNGNFPRQIYVREARRIDGLYDFRAQDLIVEPGQYRTPVQTESIACGSYEMDSHATRKYEPGIPVLEGLLGVWQHSNVYQVPYGVIVPKKVNNLLVSGAISGTHMGFSTLRMEPCWMAMGQAAGVAADIAADEGKRPADVNVDLLQQRLLASNAVITYFDDVKWDTANREALQFFGTKGYFGSYNTRELGYLDRATAALWLDQARHLGLFSRGLKKRVPEGAFVDVPSASPAYKAIRALAERGVLDHELSAREFRPHESLTPEEMTQWFASLGLEPVVPDLTGKSLMRRGEFLGALYSLMPRP